MYIHLGKSHIIKKFIRLGLFLLQDTAGSAATVEYIKYSLDSGRNNLNTQENCPKVAMKWQNLPDQHRKPPIFWDNHCVIVQ